MRKATKKAMVQATKNEAAATAAKTTAAAAAKADETAFVRCPFTRRDEFRTIQAPADKLAAWLQYLGMLHTVCIDVEKIHVNTEARMTDDETNIVEKTWTNTTYKVVSEGGLELNCQTLRNAAACAKRSSYRFINVDLSRNVVTFKA